MDFKRALGLALVTCCVAVPVLAVLAVMIKSIGFGPTMVFLGAGSLWLVLAVGGLMLLAARDGDTASLSRG